MFVPPQVNPEFKNLIPPLSKEEREQLEQNILSCRKCRDALILWNGVLIDGHNRFEICMKHGIQFEIKEMVFASHEDAMVWILENQLGRRNLNDAMRIELALAKAELLREKAKSNQILSGGDKSRDGAVLTEKTKFENQPINVRKILASEAGISEDTMNKYMQVKRDGSPELVEKVKNGELKIGTAHRMLGKEIIKQLKLADKMYKVIGRYIPYKDNNEANAEVYKGLTELRELLCVLSDKIERIKNDADKTEN